MGHVYLANGFRWDGPGLVRVSSVLWAMSTSRMDVDGTSLAYCTREPESVLWAMSTSRMDGDGMGLGSCTWSVLWAMFTS